LVMPDLPTTLRKPLKLFHVAHAIVLGKGMSLYSLYNLKTKSSASFLY